METKEYRTFDKFGWGPGPWQDEPDKMQFADTATGLPCLIVRSHTGALCGYVGVNESHPAYEKPYEDVDVSVHGGLTFSDRCRPNADEAHHICHVPAPGEPDHVWWLGFDCAHAGDIAPAVGCVWHEDRYRDIAYIKAEIKRLALQLHAMH